MRTTGPPWRVAGAYLACCALWGSTWVVIRIGLRDLPPLIFVRPSCFQSLLVAVLSDLVIMALAKETSVSVR